MYDIVAYLDSRDKRVTPSFEAEVTALSSPPSQTMSTIILRTKMTTISFRKLFNCCNYVFVCFAYSSQHMPTTRYCTQYATSCTICRSALEVITDMSRYVDTGVALLAKLIHICYAAIEGSWSDSIFAHVPTSAQFHSSPVFRLHGLISGRSRTYITTFSQPRYYATVAAADFPAAVKVGRRPWLALA